MMDPNARMGPPAAADHAPGEVLVKFKRGTRASERQQTHAVEDVDVLSEIREIGVERVRTRRGESTEALLQRYRQNPLVEYAEPNIIYHARIVPNDPRFSDLWGLHNTGQSGGTVDADIDAPEAWDGQIGSPGIVVADIDSGMDLNHPDLAANLWINPGEIAGNGIDDDGNGYVDDYRGWDFANNDNNPSDDGGHGTHTAGTIAAVGNNGVGVTGVAWQAKIMPLKFLNASGNGFTSDAVDAVLYAANMGVKITNASWGCNGASCYSQALEDAIAYANAAGMLFVVAAGNDGTNNDVTPDHPCVSTQPNVICVAATTRNDQRASFSNYGAATVDLGAPGATILSTVPNGSCTFCDPSRYLFASGTSMAAPQVSGAAALILSQFPLFTVVQLKDTILGAVDPIPALAGITATGGRLNVQRALLSNFTVTAAPASQTVNAGGSTSYTISVNSIGTFTGSVTLTFSASNASLAGSFSPGTVMVPAGGTATSTLSVSTQTGMTAGSYPVTIRGAASSETHSTTVAVEIAPPDLVVTAVNSLSSTVAPGDPLNISNTAQNQGGSNAGAFAIAFHLSVDALYGGTDDVALAPTRSVSSLAMGASSGATNMVTVPSSTPVGNYYVCAMADSGAAIAEGTAEGNNTLCSASTISVAASAATSGKLVNISTRARVQTGDNVMIGGFWITGTVPKTVLIRARGGSLGGAPFVNNPSTVLANPTMQLYAGTTVIAQNNDWQSTDPLCLSPASACGGVTQITATGLDPCQPNPGQTVAPPGCAQESAILVTVAPGGYTAIVSGVGGTSGMGLVEVFEVDTSAATLVNISTRARVQTGDNVMIGGFWIVGTTPKNVLIRARGGSLGGAPFVNNPSTVLANPTMQLYSGTTVIAQNNDWQTTDPLCLSPATACGGEPEITATGLDPCQPNPSQTVAPPGCSQESAILVTLAPGGYTAIVSGVGGTSGMGLVEVFEVP
jgi:subtilisin family serine protease